MPLPRMLLRAISRWWNPEVGRATQPPTGLASVTRLPANNASTLCPPAESDLAVTEGLQQAITEVMAWNDTVGASSSSGSHSLQAHASAAGALAAAAAALLLLL